MDSIFQPLRHLRSKDHRGDYWISVADPACRRSCRQRPAECGLACLAMIASDYGHRIDLNTLRRRHPVLFNGVTSGADPGGDPDAPGVQASGSSSMTFES